MAAVQWTATVRERTRAGVRRLAVLFLLVATARARAAGPVIERVELQRGPAPTVRLHLSAAASAIVHPLAPEGTTPPRIYIDVSGATLSDRARLPLEGAGLVLRIRSGQFDPATARVVLDLDRVLPYDFQVTGRTITLKMGPAPAEPIAAAPALPAATVPAPPAASQRPAPVEAAPVPPVASARPAVVETPPPASSPAVAPSARPIVVEPQPIPVTRAPIPPPAAPPAQHPAAPAPPVVIQRPAAVATVPVPPVASAQPAPAENPPPAPASAPSAAPAVVESPPTVVAQAPVLPSTASPAQRPTAPPRSVAPPVAPVPPVVVIDPGHGGRDPGAAGVGGVLEKDVVLELAHRLAAKLAQRLPVSVILTRTDDSYLAVQDRLPAPEPPVAVFLSLHANACRDPSPSGVEIFYGGGLWRPAGGTAANPRARALGVALARALDARLGVVRGAARPGPFAVLVRNPAPAALVEVGFLTHPEDAARARAESFQELFSDAIVDGVAAFLQTRTQL